ncbi:hypothetical protein MKW98_009117 [Papaver atlanticum]|uniref:Uncharacterized protein n=1 Tax=Papaver atlanticum TaxID=357466 RepID=A0AAD4XS25_9MAGN|nr:hypothetical protein MKW98_009117 [Papaver atlanticum]
MKQRSNLFQMKDLSLARIRDVETRENLKPRIFNSTRSTKKLQLPEKLLKDTKQLTRPAFDLGAEFPHLDKAIMELVRASSKKYLTWSIQLEFTKLQGLVEL